MQNPVRESLDTQRAVYLGCNSCLRSLIMARDNLVSSLRAKRERFPPYLLGCTPLSHSVSPQYCYVFFSGGLRIECHPSQPRRNNLLPKKTPPRRTKNLTKSNSCLMNQHGDFEHDIHNNVPCSNTSQSMELCPST